MNSKLRQTLYVIGNGFDLHHNLETSYYDFSCFLKGDYQEIYHLLESFISLPVDDDDLWRDFENNLANLDVDALLDDNRMHLPDIASDDFRSGDMHRFPDVMEDLVEKFTTELIASFTRFILNIEYSDSTLEKKISLDKNATFLTFNYTKTLQEIYKVKSNQVLHIHNSVYHRYADIVLGHGINPDTFKDISKEPPKGLSEEEKERWYEENDDWDYSYDTGKDNIYRYFKESYKPTKDIIDENVSFFSELDGIKNIFVLGHSLSSVDIPYFKKIIESIDSKVCWSVSYYSDTEKESHISTLIELGVDIGRITMIKLEELKLVNI